MVNTGLLSYLHERERERQKIDDDFWIVHDRIEESGIKEKVGGLRCHEWAHLVAKGMKQKGYDARVVDGYVTSDYRKTEHSWVEIKHGILKMPCECKGIFIQTDAHGRGIETGGGRGYCQVKCQNIN